MCKHIVSSPPKMSLNPETSDDSADAIRAKIDQLVDDLFIAVQDGNISQMDETTDSLRSVVGSPKLRELIRTIQDEETGDDLLSYAVRNIRCRNLDTMEDSALNNTGNLWEQDPKKLRGVREFVGEEAVKQHINQRKQIIRRLITEGADPTTNRFKRAVSAVGTSPSQIDELTSANVDPDEQISILDRYVRSLKSIIRQSTARASLEKEQAEETKREEQLAKCLKWADPAEWDDDNHPLMCCVEFGSPRQVKRELDDLFEPEYDTAYMDRKFKNSGVPTFLATPKHEDTDEFRLSHLLRGAMLKAVSMWAQSAVGSPERSRTEKIVLNIANALATEPAAGNPDEQGWNGYPSKEGYFMDKFWDIVTASTSKRNLKGVFEGARSTGSKLIGILTREKIGKTPGFGLRFTPNKAYDRPLVASQISLVRQIKYKILIDADIPEEQHRNFVWCLVNTDTNIYEYTGSWFNPKSRLSKQGFKQTVQKTMTLSNYDSQKIAKRSFVLCEYGDGTTNTEHNKGLKSQWIGSRYCRTVRAWDFMKFKRDNTIATGTAVAGAVALGAQLAGGYFMPSLTLFGGDGLIALGSLAATTGVTYLAFLERMRENYRINRGYIPTEALDHYIPREEGAYDKSTMKSRRLAEEQIARDDSGNLPLSYIYDCARSSQSRETLKRMALEYEKDSTRFYKPDEDDESDEPDEDDKPDKPDEGAVKPSAPPLMILHGGNTNLLPGNLLLPPTPRAPRTNFLVTG